MTALTPRQVQILQLSAGGVRDREIAERLGLSWHTIRRHLADAYARLGVDTRIAAVFKAANLGLIEPVCLGYDQTIRELREENRELRRQIAQQNRALELLDSLDELHDLVKSAGAHR